MRFQLKNQVSDHIVLLPFNILFSYFAIMRTILILILLSSFSPAQSGELIRAADLSFWEQLNDNNAKFYNHGAETPLLGIFSEAGFTHIRLRTWHTPAAGYNDIESTLKTAHAAKDAGLKLYLDFHYSDWWADPGQQNKPAAWAAIEFEQLVDSIYSYTFHVVSALNAQGTPPEIVQIGNEISNGFLWDTGRITGDFNTYQQWVQFSTLLKSARQAVLDASAEKTAPKIMIHTDRGGDNASCVWFFNKLLSFGVEFDIIGLSYYAWWHGTFANLKDNLDDLSWRYSQDIFIAETAYPFTLANQDGTNNFVWDESQLLENYPATPAGQKQYYTDLLTMLESYNGKVTGIALWEPAFRGIPGMDSPWENQLLFDFIGNSLPAFKVFETLPTRITQHTPNPAGFHVFPNYPNPFNGTTQIKFVLDNRQKVKIDIYDILGNQVLNVAEEIFNEGENRVTINSSGLSSGVYFYRLSTSEGFSTRKMLLLK